MTTDSSAAADTDPRCDFCERRFIRIVRGVAVCAEDLRNAPEDRDNWECFHEGLAAQ